MDETLIPHFDDTLRRLLQGASSVSAAAVSGGPDSMAMLWLLSRWAEHNDKKILALTVDHGLRAESAAEAARVRGWVRDWPCVTHKILRWDGLKPDTKILEEARAARYDLIAAEMKQHGIRHLFTAHHEDDQAETILIRLAKGSGLDGLSGMRETQERGGIIIVRPLLTVTKQDLVALCEENAIPYVSDPTNENDKYLRPRLRAAWKVLEEEGLSAKRLSVTAHRMARATAALNMMSDSLYREAVVSEEEGVIIFSMPPLSKAPEEIRLRVLGKSIETIGRRDDAPYPVRLERLEALTERIFSKGFSGATLGGCKFSLQKKGSLLKIERE